MGRLFDSLVDDAIGEAARREPSYLGRFALSPFDLEEQARRYGGHPLFGGWPKPRIAACLSDARSRLIDRGVRFSDGVPGRDPVAAMLLDSAMDAFAAEAGRLPLRPEPADDAAFVERFAESYDARATPDGVRYFTGRRGERPVLLVSAIGVPIAAWSKLLLDPSHGLRITVVETRHADLFAGGLRGATGPGGDARDIAAALAHAGGAPTDVLAWSNGARVAIDLVAARPAAARSLVLLAPTLSGVEGVAPIASPFEEQLTQIFAAVGSNPAAAAFFSKALGDSIRARSWDGRVAPAQRARMLLALPAAEQAPMLIATLANGELLFNFMQRYFADLEYPLRDRLRSLRLPLLAVTGDHDTIVANELTLAALRRFAPGFVHARVNGAGHCIQDLQYRYFRWLLQCFYGAGRPIAAAARVEVGG